MDKGLIDLHCHTNASDGLLSPKDLVKKADKLGLRAIGIADHDSVSGIKEARNSGEKFGVEIVPSIELSTVWNGKELHLLGYYIDYEKKWFLEIIEHFADVRTQRAKKIVNILQKEGYRVTDAEVKRCAKGNIGKPHIAKAVINNSENFPFLHKVFGKIPSTSEFIEYYMIANKVANVPKERLDITDGIKYVNSLGGIPVLAHPGYDLSREPSSVGLIVKLKEAGLQGLEAIHYVRDNDLTLECIEYFSKIAKEEELLITGGSDFHGENNSAGAPLGLIGTPFEISYLVLENLKQRKNKFNRIKG